MQFFKYDPIFLNWLITYAGNRPILDIGCGEGHLLRDLLARTPRCHGTEVRYITDEDVAPHVTVSNHGVFPVQGHPGWLHVMARPCHGDFVQNTLNKARGEVIIFTRKSTIEADAGPFFSLLRQIPVPGLHPTSDGEEVACFSFLPKSNFPWIKYEVLDDERPVGHVWLRPIKASKDTMYEHPRWGVVSAYRAAKSMGGDDLGSELERTTSDHWRSIPGDLLDPIPEDDGRSEHGWISPTGRIVSCRYFEHDKIAYQHLGLTPDELYDMGWVRTVAYPVSTRKSVIGTASRRIGDDEPPITEQQAAVLILLNERHQSLNPSEVEEDESNLNEWEK